VDLVPTSYGLVATKSCSKSLQQQQQQQQQQEQPPVRPAPTAMPTSGDMSCSNKCDRAANLPLFSTCCKFCVISNSHSHLCDQRQHQHLLPEHVDLLGQQQLAPVGFWCTQQQTAEVIGPSQESTGSARVDLTESLAIGASKATEVLATGAIHEKEIAAAAASTGPIAAIGASEELTPVQVQVDSTGVQSIEIQVSGTSQAMDEKFVLSGTGTDDPELAAAGAGEELLLVDGFWVLGGPHTFEDRSRR
jgi:hypothetical protein